jgi:hypothetical protein
VPRQLFVTFENRGDAFLDALVDGDHELVLPHLRPGVDLVVALLQLDEDLFGGCEVARVDQLVYP